MQIITNHRVRSYYPTRQGCNYTIDTKGHTTLEENNRVDLHIRFFLLCEHHSKVNSRSIKPTLSPYQEKHDNLRQDFNTYTYVQATCTFNYLLHSSKYFKTQTITYDYYHAKSYSNTPFEKRLILTIITSDMF